MFVGHYGIAFGAKPATPAVPLWVYFIAVQWLDVVWSVLVLLGVEKLHIIPGFTEANPYDLYYMPTRTACRARLCCHLRSAPSSQRSSRSSADGRF
jgi:hypothetical protein